MISVDVVIIGGGLQGLVVLRELTVSGYACLLVTNAHLGSGQTLHSHGLLNSGTGLLTGVLQAELHSVTLPYLTRLNVGVYGHDRSFLLAPTVVVDQLAPTWEANAYHPEPTNPSSLPPGFEMVGLPYRVPGFNVHKRRLVEAVSAGFEHLVVQGEVIDAEGSIRVRHAASGDVLALEPRAVVVAAGCGTKRLLRVVFGLEEHRLDNIAYKKTHMICLRGGADVLPDIGTVLSPELIVVGHRDTHARTSPERLVTWYVTPAGPAPMRYADAPDDAAADVERPVVRSGIESLVHLFPPLRDLGDRVDATVFAGFKQDFDGVPTQRACELVDSSRNILMVLPSVLANAVPNAVDAVSIVRERLPEPSGRAVDVGSLGGAAVGQLNEHSDQTRWATWGEFAGEYGVQVR